MHICTLHKACDGNISKWPDYVRHAFFADQVTVRKATGFSLYYLLYGVDPILPLDLFKATYLISGFQKNLSTAELALRIDRKSTRLNSSHNQRSRMPSSA